MAKPLEAEDQGGIPWLIYEEDPSWELVKKLKVQYIVLPRQTLLTGELVPVEKPEFKGLTPEMLTEGLKKVVIRMTRLYDCWRVLKEAQPDE